MRLDHLLSKENRSSKKNKIPKVSSWVRHCSALRILILKWGYSSAGRAPALQAGGQEFDPPYLHSNWAHSSGG